MSDLYKESGVKTLSEDNSMKGLLHWVNKTFQFRKTVGKNLLPIGFFANVIDLGNGLGLAVSTDGVGTKSLLAEMANKYDTIGIDCIAMNVNDLICVGAEPVSFVDYIAVGNFKDEVIEQLAKGLYEGCKQANVNIPGGEIAQVKEILHPGETAFDIVGTAIGIVKTEDIITGKNIKPGDLMIGFPSTGIHSNGLTLARKVLLEDKNEYEENIAEMLKPTKIYVKEALTLMKSCKVKGFANITGEGLLNIIRLDSKVKYIIDDALPVLSIFTKIQTKGQIPLEEMYKDFNMGMGFLAVIEEKDFEKASEALGKENISFKKVGFVEDSNEPQIEMREMKIISKNGTLVRY